MANDAALAREKVRWIAANRRGLDWPDRLASSADPAFPRYLLRNLAKLSVGDELIEYAGSRVVVQFLSVQGPECVGCIALRLLRR